MSTAAESYVIPDDIPETLPQTEELAANPLLFESHLHPVPDIPMPRSEIEPPEADDAAVISATEEAPLIDESLIAEAQAGNLDALTGIWLDMAPSLRKRAIQLVGPNHADDLVQTAALRVFGKIKLYQLGTNFAAWAYTILVHEGISFLRKERRHVSADFDDELSQKFEREPLFSGTPPHPEHSVVAKVSMTEFIRDVLGLMPAEFKDAILNVDIRGLGYEEYAAVSGVKLGTVRSRLHRGRAIIRDADKDGKIKADLKTKP